MIRSINTVNRNMNILQKRLEITSANMANINTPGYKFQDIVQSTLESQEMFNYTGGPNGDQRVVLGSFTYGNEIDEMYRSFEHGALVQTNMETDFAIIGNGFFTIQMENGQIAYTRNGNFKLNEEGNLTTTEGYLVVISEDLNLLITDFDDYNVLTYIGDTLFTGNTEGYAMPFAEVEKGYLETSNVSTVDEIIKLIVISREFQFNQKLVHSADETLNKVVNEVGRV